jgi:hypothetical protein
VFLVRLSSYELVSCSLQYSFDSQHIGGVERRSRYSLRGYGSLLRGKCMPDTVLTRSVYILAKSLLPIAGGLIVVHPEGAHATQLLCSEDDVALGATSAGSEAT